MTSIQMSAVVFTAGLGRSLRDLVRRLRESEAMLEILLLEEPGSDRLVARILDSLEVDPDIVRVPSRSTSRAGRRNEGVRASSADLVFFLDVGWRPEASFGSCMAAILGEQDELAFACSRFERLGPGGSSGSIETPSADLESMLGRTAALPPCTVFRRSLWQELGGFDESLADFEIDDFFLRALTGGARGRVADAVLLAHDPEASSAFRANLERTRYLPAMRALYEKHRSLFENHVSSVLVERERDLQSLAAEYRPLVDRRRRIVGEHEDLKRQIANLKSDLQELGEPTLEWGDLRRTLPISPEWGMDRGKPIDRYYIESFLAEHSDDIRGAVLEVQEDDYTRHFGGDEVETSDVVDLNPANPRATLIADLRRPSAIPSQAYDCFVISQTIHVIDDMESVLEQCHRVLKPGGVLLATFPCLSRVCLEYGQDGDFWRMTEAGALQLVSSVFPIDGVSTRVYGNVLVATAFLYGLAVDELSEEEFESFDPYHPVLIGVRAVKKDVRGAVGEERSATSISVASKPEPGSILAYHRVASCESDRHGMCISAALFRAQMQVLAERFHVLSLVEMVARAEVLELPPRAVAVTFDDGYVDALETAAPILVELGMPATFFVTTEALEKPKAFWWDLLDRVFADSVALPTELSLRWRGQERSWTTDTSSGREAAYRDLYHEVLLLSPPAQRDDVLRQLARWSGVHLRPEGQTHSMNGKQVCRLAEIEGMSIGAHGIHHLALSKQAFLSQQKEVVESRIALERLLGCDVDTFAYPYGDFDETVVDLVRAADYRIAVTCEEASVGERRLDRLRLPRRTPPRKGQSHFAAWLERVDSGE